jgi:predicted nucleotidyltransferase component of viral defense system
VLLDPLRAAAIQGLFDDELSALAFVLKGGNALRLYGIGKRGSLDLDLSIPEDLADLADVAHLLQASLSRSYERLGYELFDFRFGPRPSASDPKTPAWWGGYECNFKVAPKGMSALTIEQKRRSATVIGPLQERKFRIQISKHEFCGIVEDVDLDETIVKVYAPALIAAEKLRAVCQQMDEYPYKRPKTPRARDFYDIHSICSEASISMTADGNIELVRRCFLAKRVAPELLRLLPRYREFHRSDWAAVEVSVAVPLLGFDFYFDFVSDLALQVGRRLE